MTTGGRVQGQGSGVRRATGNWQLAIGQARVSHPRIRQGAPAPAGRRSPVALRHSAGMPKKRCVFSLIAAWNLSQVSPRSSARRRAVTETIHGSHGPIAAIEFELEVFDFE